MVGRMSRFVPVFLCTTSERGKAAGTFLVADAVNDADDRAARLSRFNLDYAAPPQDDDQPPVQTPALGLAASE